MTKHFVFMKKTLFIIAMGITSLSLFAQQDSVTVETKTYNKVLSKTVVTEEDGKSSSTLNINIPVASRHWSDKRDEHYSDLYFSFAYATDKNLPINSTKSWEWGMYPLSGTILHSHNYRTLLTWGFGFSRTSFKLKEQGPKDDMPMFVAQRFSYWSWRLPISLEYRSDNYKDFISVGVEAEMRHHVRARGYGDTHPNYVVGLNKNIVNPWAGNVLVQAGHKDCGIIARIALTDLFDKEETHLHAMPFSIGLSLGF